jgi:hypothetical protein
MSGSIEAVMVDDSGADVCFHGTRGSIDANGLKDVSPGYNCMRTASIDVQSSYLGSAPGL